MSFFYLKKLTFGKTGTASTPIFHNEFNVPANELHWQSDKSEHDSYTIGSKLDNDINVFIER